MSENPFSLEGKTVLVTGASSGIGRAVAVAAAKMGASLVLTGRDAGRLAETAALLPGASTLQVAADLVLGDSRNALVDACPALDGVVFSAGLAAMRPMRMAGEDHLRQMLSVNYEAPVLLTQRLLARKKINAGASLVYVTATAAHLSPVATGAYAGAKAALVSTVRTIASEHAKTRIRANCLAPGYVNTPMYASLDGVTSFEGNHDLFPLGISEPEDVAHGVVYLLSEASRWVTRSTLNIDGGHSLLLRQ
jgi:NAD(P)-dependent dehydrogenase (short-subunit alcohol dehydrogenase family)